mmetsp:Transcript_54353/g.128366  ORF Transcript_54353/g.128366 Transcript_54353/m.128366 type:complete len:169 (+) Transcript_54353:169-675(+)|eukprot:CAMPEP_0117057366 /NCGR_PEP_ID=MMETSP0472-20121206/39829_1 /TAXON_ID=693140 ORGANISM="Tiarina fusus, Strain LIS" /NCGR_SAMPLE_ID=MMETSP0472 /ASSEMBLY_ACC=CAM_ASM_000603 /LENGTH=168 /DNA_ID=CAMNT_0004774229 /DNA_START=42 /DNA_END=548 /DNA_ORIENTATION=-
MKPAWDKLMDEYKDHATVVIGDVDCTAAGKPLCDANGVQGYPTIKYGDPSNLEKYQGGRSFDDLLKFAKGLKPVCSPANLDVCDAEQKAKIAELQALSAADLDAKIQAGDDEMKAAEKNFESEVQKLQNAYQQLQKDKEAKLEEIKNSGLGLMKAVRAAQKSGGKTEL